MITLKEALTKKYPKYARRLTELWANANEEPMTWEMLTRSSLMNFVEYMRSNLAANSAKTYAAMFKAVLTLYADQISLPKDYAKALKVRSEAVVSTWLTEAEIDRLIDYEPTTRTEAVIRDQFILGCLTGARHSDYECFTPQNIVGDNLVYISKKTQMRSELPLSPAVRRILENGGNSERFSITTFNDKIRQICQNAGITDMVQIHVGGKTQCGEKWQFVSSHTARRSFATNVYLRCNDIFRVSRYMGHASVDMTAKYILSIGDAPEDVRRYFEQFI